MKKYIILSIILCLFTTKANASYIGLYSFYPETMFQFPDTTCTSQNTIFTSNYALKCAGGGTAQINTLVLRNTNGSVHTPSAYSSISSCFNFYAEVSGTYNQDFIVFENSSAQFSGKLRLNTTGKIEFCTTSTCTTLTAGTTTITSDTWHRICYDHAISTDSFKLWLNEEVDGTPEITSTDNLTSTDVGQIRLTSGLLAGLDFYFEDVVVNNVLLSSDAELSADMYNASVQMMPISTDGAVACTGITGRDPSDRTETNCASCTTTNSHNCINYTCTEPGDDTNYINSANGSIRYDAFALNDIVDLTDPQDVYAIAATLRMRGSGGTTGESQINLGLGSGTTCATSSSTVEATTEYRQFTYVHETKPAGGSYTLTNLNSLVLALAKVNTNNTARYETACVEFATSEPVSAGFGGGESIMWFTKILNFYKHFFQTPSAYAYLMG